MATRRTLGGRDSRAPNAAAARNAPATGKALAELIAAGAVWSVDLYPFDPARLPAAHVG